MSSKPSILKHPHFDYWFYGSLAYLAYFLFATYREFTSYVELKTPLIYSITFQEYFGNLTTYILPAFAASWVIPIIRLKKIKPIKEPSDVIFALGTWVFASCLVLICVANQVIGPIRREELKTVEEPNFGLKVSYVATESLNLMGEENIDVYLMKAKNLRDRSVLYSGYNPDLYQRDYQIFFKGGSIEIVDPLCVVVNYRKDNVEFGGRQYQIKYLDTTKIKTTD